MRIYITQKDLIKNRENNLVDLFLSDGKEIEALEPRRLFPVSKPNEYITLLDEEGTEIAVIRSLSDLNQESKEVITDSLQEYYLVPQILRIVDVVEKYGTLRWTVETNRGIKSFDIRNRNHDIRVYPDGRVRIRDSNDNRYTISNWRNLDNHSKMLMIADI